MESPRPTVTPRPSSARFLATGSVTWAVCFAWWLISFFSDWSLTGWTFVVISGAVAVIACVIGAALTVRHRWAVAILGGALAAVAAIAIVDFLTYEIGSNL